MNVEEQHQWELAMLVIVHLCHNLLVIIMKFV